MAAAPQPATRMASLLASRSLRTANAPLARSFARPLAAAHFGTSSVARKPATSSMTSEENLKLLNQYRATRPISPHLTIYRYPLNMYMSISNRITGAALSAGMYVGALTYLALPAFGFDMAAFVPSIVDAVAHLPVAAKLAAKTVVAVPFVYHSVNGVRHLMWDSGRLLSRKRFDPSGVATLVVSAVGTVALVGLGTFY